VTQVPHAAARLEVVPALAPTAEPRDLADALRRGPFHLALQAAIRATGLSLESVQRRLRAQGHQISMASLSYWQRGRSRPERPSSLAAVRTLERILELPPGSLITLLGPARPRGRWVNHVPGSVPFAALGHSERTLRMVSSRIDPDVNQRLETISHHEDLYVDAEGRGYRQRIRRVLRARSDGTDRMIVVIVADDPGNPRPSFSPLLNCRLGRVVHDDEEDVTAAEMIFHRPLRAGETYLAEYEVVAHDLTTRASRLEVGFRQPTRECVLQAVFHPSAIPIRCYPVWQPQTRQPSPLDPELHIEASGSVHVAFTDLPAGRYGLYWEWD
jgi:hypothetical protein